jgi:hypothetical protein
MANIASVYLSRWQDLAKIADWTSAMPDQPLPECIDVRSVLATLRTLRAEVEAMWVQADHREARDKLLENAYAPFFRRVEFELALRPLPELDGRDEAALAGLVP